MTRYIDLETIKELCRNKSLKSRKTIVKLSLRNNRIWFYKIAGKIIHTSLPRAYTLKEILYKVKANPYERHPWDRKLIIGEKS